ncbi:polar amino acid transport system substrate-binding protein [Pilibacter termitis]|uniref:Polar amino acid transport system substrate-binding protein n=1 Tax=Pilibacter termitis TaxID=263852 RepID=A0A1T4KAW1_9ENTE|nr:transporter substrate-binding domain-containing protein [Pilibacter termitis]SJZ39570.1 polar amino acid transport system substrate-binding protein [Pilibacter termitis]
MKTLKKLLPFLLLSGFALFFGKSAHATVYNIGTDLNQPPFEYKKKDGTMTGMEMEVLQEIARIEDFQYTLITANFSSLLTSVQTGELDGVISAVTITDNRKAAFDFSAGYMDTGLAIATLKSSKDITKPEDLRGKTVLARRGTLGANWAMENRKVYGWNVVLDDQEQDTIQTFVANAPKEYAAFIDDVYHFSFEMKKRDDLKFVGKAFEKGAYGFAVKKGENQELLKKINDGIQKIKTSGKLNEIKNKYFKGVKIPAFEKESNETFVIAMNSDNAPFCYQNNQNRIVGLEYDLLNEIAKRVGFKIEYKFVQSGSGYALVENKQVDAFFSGLRMSEEMTTRYASSLPYTRSGIQFCTYKDGAYKDIADLKGSMIGVMSGMNSVSWLKENQERFDFHIHEFDTGQTDMIREAKRLKVDALLTKAMVINFHTLSDSSLQKIGEEFDIHDISCIANKEYDGKFIVQFNKGLKEMQKDGSYQDILEQYLVYGEKSEKVPKTAESLGKSESKSSNSLTYIIVASVFGVVVLLGVIGYKMHIERRHNS